MANRLNLAFFFATLSPFSIAQTPAVIARVPGVKVTSTGNATVNLSGTSVRSELSGNSTEIFLDGKARVELIEEGAVSLVLTADKLRIRSDELTYPPNTAAKRNLSVPATGNCVLVSKGIRCESKQLQLKEDSLANRIDIELNGDVIVTLGNVTLVSDSAVVSRTGGTFQLQGRFTVSKVGGEQSDPTETSESPGQVVC